MKKNPKSTTQEPEIVLAEFISLKRHTLEQKDSRIRFRIVKRKTPFGSIVTQLDIREYIIDEKKAMYTRKGLTFYTHEISTIIDNLLKMKAYFVTNQEAVKDYGTNSRN